MASDVVAFLLEECLPAARRAPERARALAADVHALCDAWRPFAPHPRALFKVRAQSPPPQRQPHSRAPTCEQAVIDAVAALTGAERAVA